MKRLLQEALIWTVRLLKPRGARTTFLYRAKRAIQQSDLERGRLYANLSIAASPSSDAYRLLGFANFQLQQLVKARDAYSKAALLSRNDSVVLGETADVEFALKNYSAAESLWRKVLETHPLDLKAFRKLSQLLLMEGRLDEAEQMLMSDSIANWRDPGVLAIQGELLRARGRYESALEKLNTALSLDPAQNHAHYEKALSLAALGRWNEALKPAQETVALSPTDAESQKLLRMVEGRVLEHDAHC
jgi:tetratricopeptide (TPR) repeat protein